MEKMSNNPVLEKPATKGANSGKTVSETEETVRQLHKHQRRGKFQNGKIFFQRDIMKLWTESVYCIILLSGQLGRDTEELAQRKADSPDQ